MKAVTVDYNNLCHTTTLGHVLAIHRANYDHDDKANQIIKRLESFFGHDENASITLPNKIVEEYTDHIIYNLQSILTSRGLT
jgi:hypothetical protein